MPVRCEHCPSCKCGLVADGLHTSRTGCRADSRYSYRLIFISYPTFVQGTFSPFVNTSVHMVSNCQGSTGMVDGNPCSIGGLLMVPHQLCKCFLVWG